jgi:peroxiredoxin
MLPGAVHGAETVHALGYRARGMVGGRSHVRRHVARSAGRDPADLRVFWDRVPLSYNDRRGVTQTKIRWVIATAAVPALVLLILNLRLPMSDGGLAPDVVACQANAKPATLDFTLKDTDNRDVRLGDFKGKVIVLNFWATWCGPCALEIPGFVELQNAYGQRGLQVVGVSIDDTLEKLKPFAARFGMNYPVLQGLGQDSVQDAFGPIIGLPTTVVIGRDGRVCRKHTGLSTKEAFEREIKSLL